MGLTLAQLTAPQSADQVTTDLLNSLAGRGIVIKTAGTGTGSLAISGTPNGTYAAILKIVTTSGELGTAQYQYSTDGGATFSGAVVTPANGTITLGATGVTMQLAAGPTGSGTSFVVGDKFTFSLSAPNFPVTSWPTGAALRSLVQAYGQSGANFQQAIANIASGGLLYASTGSWLDLLATNVYGLTRNAAVATQVTVILTDAQSAGPFTIVAGQLWVQGASTGLRYNNVGGGTLSKGGTLSLTFQAETPAAAYNAGDGTITTMATPLPGVVCNNPGPNSITVSGTDAESDAALQARCAARWSALGTGATAAAYKLWALTSSASITRVQVVTDAAIAGQVDVYIAGASGPSPGGDVTAAQNYINARIPLAVGCVVAAATGVGVTVNGTVYIASAYNTAQLAQAQITAALAALFQAVPVGGTYLGASVTPPAGKTGVVSLEQVVAAIMGVTGVVDLNLTTPAADTWLAATEVATLTQTLTYQSV